MWARDARSLSPAKVSQGDDWRLKVMAMANTKCVCQPCTWTNTCTPRQPQGSSANKTANWFCSGMFAGYSAYTEANSEAWESSGVMLSNGTSHKVAPLGVNHQHLKWHPTPFQLFFLNQRQHWFGRSSRLGKTPRWDERWHFHCRIQNSETGDCCG